MGGTRRERTLGAATAVLLLLGGAVGSQGGALSPPGSDGPAATARRAGTTTAGSARGGGAWRAETITTSAGEQVHLEVSAGYASDPQFARSWAEFFGGLVHGAELAQVTIRIVAPTELDASCGPQTLGCYATGRMVIPGEQVGGIEPAEIARHEYGHHIAATRRNPPWNASTWGPKRWATRTGICTRAASGEISPDSYANYELSPREAFAEVYRVLNDRRAGIAALAWSIVDDSFIPDDAALLAAEEDVTKPWVGATTTRIAGRFRAGGPRRWTKTIATPLDGQLTVELRLPAGRDDRVELLDVDGRVLARGLWAGTSAKRLAFVVCGQREVRVRVSLRGRPGTLGLTIARP
jgi:hypothetical protein